MMRECPVCKAVAFDDARICYGCLHRFEDGVGIEEPPTDPVVLTGSLGKAEKDPPVAARPAGGAKPAIGVKPGDCADPGRESGTWSVRIEFSGLPSRFDGMGMALGRLFDGDGVVPSFAATEDGFVMSVGIPSGEAEPSGRAIRRRPLRASRSSLRRLRSNAPVIEAGCGGQDGATG